MCINVDIPFFGHLNTITRINNITKINFGCGPLFLLQNFTAFNNGSPLYT